LKDTQEGEQLAEAKPQAEHPKQSAPMRRDEPEVPHWGEGMDSILRRLSQ
jgi:hypothetical protein